MSSALYEFMPYGAPELIEGAPRRLFRSTVWGAALWIAAYLVLLGWMIVRPKSEEPPRTVVISYRELAPPPPLTSDAPPPPEVVIVRPSASPVVGIPVPVPDVEAPPDQTIASQEEIAQSTGSEGISGEEGVIVLPPPPADELPGLGQFVYADELPVLITDVAPRYPQVAKDAQVEGEIYLRVLVGKDGHVKDVHVDRSIPMLDEAAMEAARQWVFKPALANNQPVAVWVARRLKFRLTAPAS